MYRFEFLLLTIRQTERVTPNLIFQLVMHKFLLLFLSFKWSACQRRITNSSSVDNSVNTNFMISIVSARVLDSIPGWVCGGSIIHPSLILTSASCLHTVTKMYAIIGYRMYVRTEDLETDHCSRHMKKRIMHFCVHSEYGNLKSNIDQKHTSEERKYKWAIFDIGIARTETPIDFFDSNYVKYCSYLPNSILVNYHKKFEVAGVDVVVYGWGHASHYRPVLDKNDYNSRTLRYTSSKILDKNNCDSRYKNRYMKTKIITSYICADGEGNMDAYGQQIVKARPERYKCGSRRSSGNYSKFKHQNTSCVYDKHYGETKLNNKTHNIIFLNTRRNGICQNDHGSPLVRWIGGHAYVLGVASAFQVNKKMECVGPYLYTSVHCTSRFVRCVLAEQYTVQTRRTPRYCDAPDNERGFKIEKTNVDWSENMDGSKKTTSDYGLYD